MRKKRPDDAARPPPTAETPLVLTLRDVEVPPPPAAASKPADDGLVMSDRLLPPEPVPDDAAGAAEAPPPAAPRLAEPSFVVSDRFVQPEPSPAPAVEAPAPPPAAAEPAAPSLVESDAEPRPEPYLGDPDADRAAQRAARRAQVRRDRARDTAAEASDLPQMLVLGNDGDACAPLGALLGAFGFGVQRMAVPPDLPAPWPFAAVFVVMPMHGADALDMCNQVRETSRLPGEKKPLLVLAAPQLSSTDRVRAGLAGCNEILLGPPSRGNVAQLLDARGIVLPTDARRAS